MSSSMMDTVPGGESNQYESIQTVTKPHSSDSGTMGAGSDRSEAPQYMKQDNAERGEQTAENIRYGQNISESGMGGKTTTSGGSANQEGSGARQEGQTETEQARTEQGYPRGGSGVGA